MSQCLANHEDLVLDVLSRADSLTIEQLVERIPELSWSELFETIDTMSRKGAIILRRRGFDYEVSHRAASVRSTC
ncbi:MAG: hypothetical protein HY281_11695 [Nitrospirae bacterium]|nr:hypothetical protein [Nitrospirota bacterium]